MENKTLTLTKKEVEIIENAISYFWDTGVEKKLATIFEAASSISAIETVMELAQEREKEGDGWTVTPNVTSAVTAVTSSMK